MERKDTEEAKEILHGIQDIKVELARFLVHQEQHRKEIDFITLKVEEHEKNQNKFFGFITLIGIAATAFFTWLFKHF